MSDKQLTSEIIKRVNIFSHQSMLKVDLYSKLFSVRHFSYLPGAKLSQEAQQNTGSASRSCCLT